MSILVNDQNRARRFYTDALGFSLKHDIPVGEAPESQGRRVQRRAQDGEADEVCRLDDTCGNLIRLMEG